MKMLPHRLSAHWFIGLFSLAAIRVSAQTYTFTDLGTLGGIYSYAYGINAAGQVVGKSAISSTSPQHAFLYSGGVMTDLDVPAGPASEAWAINASGQIAGDAWTAGYGAYYVFSNSVGVMTSLGAWDGSAAPRAINSSGQIVGYSASGNGALLYSGGAWTQLFGGDSRALGINSSGQIVGYNTSGGFLLTGGFGGVVTPLGVLRPNAINDSGVIVGGSYDPAQGYVSHPYSYVNGVTTRLDAPDYTGFGVASAINSLGQIVGTSGGPFIYSGGTMTYLSSLTTLPLDWALQSATGINDIGQIVGSGVNGAGQQHAYLLTPIPEPGTYAALIGLAALGVAVFRRRRRQTG